MEIKRKWFVEDGVILAGHIGRDGEKKGLVTASFSLDDEKKHLVLTAKGTNLVEKTPVTNTREEWRVCSASKEHEQKFKIYSANFLGVELEVASLMFDSDRYVIRRCIDPVKEIEEREKDKIRSAAWAEFRVIAGNLANKIDQNVLTPAFVYKYRGLIAQLNNKPLEQVGKVLQNLFEAYFDENYSTLCKLPEEISKHGPQIWYNHITAASKELVARMLKVERPEDLPARQESLRKSLFDLINKDRAKRKAEWLSKHA